MLINQMYLCHCYLQCLMKRNMDERDLHFDFVHELILIFYVFLYMNHFHLGVLILCHNFRLLLLNILLKYSGICHGFHVFFLSDLAGGFYRWIPKNGAPCSPLLLKPAYCPRVITNELIFDPQCDCAWGCQRILPHCP